MNGQAPAAGAAAGPSRATDTAAALLREGQQELAGSPSARLDAELLLAHACRMDRAALYRDPQRGVSAPDRERFRALIARRRSGVPLAYLLGEKEFWSLSIEVTQQVLIPRPETELLVALALDAAPGSGACDVLDLGTGSGAVAIALGTERPQWRIVAVDRSVPALRVAERNLRRHGLTKVELREGSWFAAVPGECFDLIVANPPYLRADDPALRTSDLSHEPSAALVAGADGLADLREIVRGAGAQLRPGGSLLLEHGATQGPALRALLAQAGFQGVFTAPDLAGLPRVSGGRRAGARQ